MQPRACNIRFGIQLWVAGCRMETPGPAMSAMEGESLASCRVGADLTCNDSACDALPLLLQPQARGLCPFTCTWTAYLWMLPANWDGCLTGVCLPLAVLTLPLPTARRYKVTGAWRRARLHHDDAMAAPTRAAACLAWLCGRIMIATATSCNFATSALRATKPARPNAWQDGAHHMRNCVQLKRSTIRAQPGQASLHGACQGGASTTRHPVRKSINESSITRLPP